MKLNLYSVFDKATQAYMRPSFFQSDAQAVRAFIDECRKDETPMYAHPEDYAFFRIGMFEDNTGELTAEEPTCLVRAHEIPKEDGNA